MLSYKQLITNFRWFNTTQLLVIMLYVVFVTQGGSACLTSANYQVLPSAYTCRHATITSTAILESTLLLKQEQDKTTERCDVQRMRGQDL